MRFRLDVTLEAISITTLLLAHLAVEFEFLQTFRFDFFGNVLYGPLFRFRHDK